LFTFEQYFENDRSSQNFGAVLCIDFGQKLGWATFWAISSQTHRVTLVSCHRFEKEALQVFVPKPNSFLQSCSATKST
jgi:hypothetical protein